MISEYITKNTDPTHAVDVMVIMAQKFIDHQTIAAVFNAYLDGRVEKFSFSRIGTCENIEFNFFVLKAIYYLEDHPDLALAMCRVAALEYENLFDSNNYQWAITKAEALKKEREEAKNALRNQKGGKRIQGVQPRHRA